MYGLLPVGADTAAHRLEDWAGGVLARADASLGVVLRAGIGGAVADVDQVPESRHEADQVLRVLTHEAGRRVASINDVRPQANAARTAGHADRTATTAA